MLWAQVPDNVDSSECSIPPPPKDFDIKLKWQSSDQNPVHVNGCSTPMVADLDGDGRPEVIAVWTTATAGHGDTPRPNSFISRNLIVFNGQDGALLRVINTVDYQIHGQTIAIADVNPSRHDGAEIFIVGIDKKLYCYRGIQQSNALKWVGNDSGDEVIMDYMYIPMVADINADGVPEVVCGKYIFNAQTGALVLQGTMDTKGMGHGSPHNVEAGRGNWNSTKVDLGEAYYMCAIADMDGDGHLEICAGNSVYKPVITKKFSTNGNTWSILRQCESTLPHNDMYDGQTIVLDFDNDGDLDVCVLGRRVDRDLETSDFVDGNNHMGVYVWDGQTSQMIGYHVCDPHSFSQSIPFAGDLNGDGYPEIIFNGWLKGYHYDAATYPDMMHVFTYQAWYSSTANNTVSSNIREVFTRDQTKQFCESAGFTVFDFNQDGKSEIVFRNEKELIILDGENLNPLCTPIPAVSATTAEYPIVADVDGDGHADIIITEQYRNHAVTAQERTDGKWIPVAGRVSVYQSRTSEAWAPARKVWNQWPYNVVNINEDMSVPQHLYNIAKQYPNGIRPYNTFLQQATIINVNGDQFFPAPDANLVQDISAIRSICDSVVMDLCFSNEGSAPLTAPYGLTVYKDEYRGEVLRTRIFPTDLEPKDTMCVHLSFKASEIKELLPIERYVVTINDIGTGIEKEGGQQEECDTTNNKLIRAFEDLKFTAHYDTTVTICSNKMPFYFIDRYLKTGGDYGFALKTSQDCDSIVMLHLRVKDPVYNVETLVACDSCTWHGTKYTESGTYVFDYIDGCPCADTLHLTINYAIHNVEEKIVCESYEWHGNEYTASGVYTYGYTNTDGCPCTDTLHLTVKDTVTRHLYDEVCLNTAYIAHGFSVEAIETGTAGEVIVKEQTAPGANGCDSTTILHLTVIPVIHKTETTFACDSLVWHDVTYKESGAYTFDYENEFGCPSTDTLHLTVFHSSRHDTVVDVCKNELPFVFLGRSLTRSDEYEFHLETAHGCDSLVVLHLTVYLTYNRNKDMTVCEDELPILFMDSVITKGGDYVFKKKSLHGCDSMVTLHLTVNENTHNVETEIACDSFTWHGVKYVESGDYTFDYDNETGCPSTDTLHLTINHSMHSAMTTTECDSIIWHGTKYTESGDYVYDYINSAGCPCADTLHLTIHYTEVSDTSVVACDSYLWYGESYTESGDYKKIWTSPIPEACDRIANLHLTIHRSTHNVISETACDSLTWHGVKYTESGDYTYDYENENGCPSTDTLHLTVHHSLHTAMTEIACDFMIWHDKTYTESGDYTFDYENDEGCPSTDTLHLTIHKSVEIDTIVVICEEELPIIFMDSMITEGGDVEFQLKTIHGCDSVITLHLIVQPASEQDTIVNVCDYDMPYLFADSVLAEGGDYEFRLKSLYGCDSTVMLHLQVHPSPTITLGEDQRYCSAEFVSAQIEAPEGFESYEWSDGSVGQIVTVNSAGRYSVQVTDANQCTATDTIEIILIENPDVEIQIQSESSCIHESALLTAISSVQDVAYIWSTGETTQYIEITRHGEYSVLADNQGCLGGDTITIAACDCDIWVPNAFTPNDDALNDRFDPIPSATLGYFHLAIYNRFGELLFQTKDINEGWDGTFKGKLVPLGVYSYVIYYSCKALPEFIKLKKGSVTVVR
jgi:gliding motility-associated-like protein